MLYQNLEGGLWFLEEGKSCSTKVVCQGFDIGRQEGQVTAKKFLDHAVWVLTELLKSSKTPSTFLDSVIYLGGLEDIVKINGLRENMGIKSCMLKDPLPNDMGRGQRLTKTLACKLALSQRATDTLEPFPILNQEDVRREGFIKKIRLFCIFIFLHVPIKCGR